MAASVAEAVEIAKKDKAAVILACGGSGRRFSDAVGTGAVAGAVAAAGAEAGAAVAAVAGAAAGAGVGEAEAKQFLMLGDRPVLAYSLAFLENYSRVDEVVLVLPEQHLERGEALIRGQWLPGLRFTKVKAVLAGGESRQESVSKGLAALTHRQGLVLIHDGVRPCTPREVFDRVIDGVLTWGNAVAAIPVRDTIKRADQAGIVRETLERQGLWQIQTPQGFMLHELRQAYRQAGEGLTVTDDAALMEACGCKIHLVEGHPANIKLTYPEDLLLLEAFLSRA
ncbi:MAG: 2-C-methyl-D-erythritol 4-phosphate cytidylyltransferase [Clostridiales bacterium]